MKELKKVSWVLLLLILAGCNIWNTPDRADRLLTAGWTGPTPDSGSRVRTTLYCYQTLADVDCYTTPQAELLSRLVGIYGMGALQPDEANKTKTEDVSILAKKSLILSRSMNLKRGVLVKESQKQLIAENQ